MFSKRLLIMALVIGSAIAETSSRKWRTLNDVSIREKRRLTTAVDDLFKKLTIPTHRPVLPPPPVLPALPALPVLPPPRLPELRTKKTTYLDDYLPFTPIGRLNFMKLLRETPLRAGSAMAHMVENLTPHLKDAIDIIKPEVNNVKTRIDNDFSKNRYDLTEASTKRSILKSRIEENLQNLVDIVEMPETIPDEDNILEYSRRNANVMLPESGIRKLPYDAKRMFDKFNRLAAKILPIFSDTVAELIPKKH